MPGVVGFCGPIDPERSAHLLGRMAAALQHEGLYRSELHSDVDLGLGRLTLGIVNAELQPMWNETRSVCLVMEGEIFGSAALQTALQSEGVRCRDNSQAEVVLRLYEHAGDEFAHQLNGAFVIVVWDARRRRLLVTNDRLGLHPLYYAQIGSRFTFASGVRALLADADLPRQIDRVGLAQYLTFDHMLGERTLLESVRLLPAASVLTTEDGSMRLRSYWTLQHDERYPPRRDQEYLEAFRHFLRQAVARQTADDLPAGLLLSGGLDSRVVMAALRERGIGERLQCFTFGIPGCDDARFAREVAHRCRTRHHFSPLVAEYLIEHAAAGVRLNDGLQNCVHMHSLPHLSAQAAHASVLYKGVMGEMGCFLTRHLWTGDQKEAVAPRHLHALESQDLILFEAAQLKELFADGSGVRLAEAVTAAFEAALVAGGSGVPANQQNSFHVREHLRRLTLLGVELVRSRAVVRLPFCDNDLLDFILSVPPGLRFERYLLKQVLVQSFSDLAKVPYTETNQPLVPCARDVLIRVNVQARWRLRAAGLSWVRVPERRPYTDYDGWIRTVLRGWVEEILLSKRCMERGYFNPDAVRRLLGDHMAGANHAKKLGALLAIELWHRQVLD